jgi:hypothetical protein
MMNYLHPFQSSHGLPVIYNYLIFGNFAKHLTLS